MTSVTPPQSPLSSSRPKSRLGCISTLLLTLIPFVILGVGLSQFWWPSYQQKQLIKTGIQAPAQITSIEPTGSTYNDQPQVVLTVNVQPMQGAAFTAKTKMVIHPINIPQFQPGARVTVYYDPKDKTNVAIE